MGFERMNRIRLLAVCMFFCPVLQGLAQDTQPVKRRDSERYIVQGDVGYFISNIAYVDESGEVVDYFRNAVRLNVVFNIWKDLKFKSTAFIDINKPEIAPPWISNLFYQIGFYRWQHKRFSFGYENYQPNTWSNIPSAFGTNLRRGFFFTKYNYHIAKPKRKQYYRPLFWDETSKIIINPGIRFHAEYQNNLNEFGGYAKPILEMAIRYVIIKNIYVETTLFYYPWEHQKLVWEPDYSYGFGIFDYQAFKVNITYGNWVANRFPWNTKELDYYGFMNGELVISLNYAW